MNPSGVCVCSLTGDSFGCNINIGNPAVADSDLAANLSVGTPDAFNLRIDTQGFSPAYGHLSVHGFEPRLTILNSNPAVATVNYSGSIPYTDPPWGNLRPLDSAWGFGPRFQATPVSTGATTFTAIVTARRCTDNSNPVCNRIQACALSRTINVLTVCNAAAPTATNITSPNVNDFNYEVINNALTINWSNSANANRYRLVFTPNLCAGGACGSPFTTTVAHNPAGAFQTYTLGNLNNTVTFPRAWQRVTVQVFPENSTCATVQTAPAATRTINLKGRITGNIYSVSGVTRTTSCTNPPFATNAAAGGNTGARYFVGTAPASGTTTVINGATTFSYLADYAPAGAYIVAYNPDPTPTDPSNVLQCMCPSTGPGNCQYNNVPAPGQRNFFISSVAINQAWFNVFGGAIYAMNPTPSASNAIRAFIPTTCTPGVNCVPRISRNNPTGTTNTAGLVMTGNGSINTAPTANAITEHVVNASALGTAKTRREDYSYFSQLYDMPNPTPLSLNYFTGGAGRSSLGNATKPTSAPEGGKAAYYASGNLMIQQPWNVGATETIVIFVNGDLTIRDPGTSNPQMITVAPGGFLAFIVSGRIVIEDTIGHPSPYTQTTANIEGVFISNGEIEINGNPNQPHRRFIGAGNFIGWGGVDLQRDYAQGPGGNLGPDAQRNNDTPAETFIFRPDFVDNVPYEMTSANTRWQEIN